MIGVQEVIDRIPHCETFCSVEKLYALVERLGRSKGFRIEVAGKSRNGRPIHHVRFGSGRVKALLVAGPHCMEPIGSVTVFDLLTLLERGTPTLLQADVEWNIVPCIDPDGAVLNEGWTQKAFSLDNHMRSFYLQPLAEGVDTSFPVRYKELAIEREPSTEAGVLKKLLDRTRPDFYFPLHNTFAGGAFYYANRDLGSACYREIHRLLDAHRFPVRSQPQYSEFLAPLAEGILEMYTVRKHYDFLEKTLPRPADFFLNQGYGAASWDYLDEIKPEALTFVAEMGHFRHPSYGSETDTGHNLRQFKLRVEADSKFVAAAVFGAWESVKNDVDRSNPLYDSVVGLALPTQERIVEGGWPVSRYPTRDTLFNPLYDRPMKEGEKFDACIVNDGLKFLAYYFQLVRLLRASSQTPAIGKETTRLEGVLERTFVDIARHFDLTAIEVFDCDTLARVQLGSGLIALNSVLASPPACR
jgi:hypothetical protein